jgi:hypothetical protein
MLARALISDGGPRTPKQQHFFAIPTTQAPPTRKERFFAFETKFKCRSFEQEGPGEVGKNGGEKTITVDEWPTVGFCLVGVELKLG